jgi:hypothetical protein
VSVGFPILFFLFLFPISPFPCVPFFVFYILFFFFYTNKFIEQSDANSNYLKVQVSDTGVGMSDDQVSSLLHPNSGIL